MLDEPTPSNCIKNSVFSLLDASFSSDERLVRIESTSSMKMMLGDYIAAIMKSVRISFSLSPSHFETRVLALILKKVDLHSVATAFASNVFPFPGGP